MGQGVLSNQSFIAFGLCQDYANLATVNVVYGVFIRAAKSVLLYALNRGECRIVGRPLACQSCLSTRKLPTKGFSFQVATEMVLDILYSIFCVFCHPSRMS